MSDLAKALGNRGVRRLSELCGGRHLNVPGLTDDATSVAARRRLVALVGPDLAADLITNFARSRVYVPSGPSPYYSRKRPIDLNRVGALTKAGHSAKSIARLLKCTVRTVHKKRAQLARIAKEPTP